jgi:hypothetical protein
MLALKSRHLQPILKPLALKEVPKVIQAMRQTQSRKVLVKLLTRIKVGVFRLVGVDSTDCSACRRLRTSLLFVR